jgi:hypothetical protein
MNNHHPKGGFMPHYLNPSVVLRYDFIITYLAIISRPCFPQHQG